MRDEYDFSGGKRGAVIQPRGKTRITLMLLWLPRSSVGASPDALASRG